MDEFVQAGKFKAQCLSMMDVVKSTGKQIIITKRRVPIAKLCPINPTDTALFGKLQGTVHEKGDLIEPIGEAWDANH